MGVFFRAPSFILPVMHCRMKNFSTVRNRDVHPSEPFGVGKPVKPNASPNQIQFAPHHPYAKVPPGRTIGREMKKYIEAGREEGRGTQSSTLPSFTPKSHQWMGVWWGQYNS